MKLNILQLEKEGGAIIRGVPYLEEIRYSFPKTDFSKNRLLSRQIKNLLSHQGHFPWVTISVSVYVQDCPPVKAHLLKLTSILRRL